MTTAAPLARYRAVECALASGFATAKLHHPAGHDPEQLPQETDSVIRIGLEPLESGEVERRRYDRILESTARFDAKAKNLRYVYCHYLMPESPPDESWAFDETVQWRRITGTEQRPLEYPLLVLPGDTEVRFGPYWAT
ncbi:hypothetical protein NKH28_14930 [Mesorhizobium sp. M1227]|uniref:hypothetical protein n=1 Tax=Mesorhizobium sp. M1227 TaxID=2957071 RepID=UPI003337E7F3